MTQKHWSTRNAFLFAAIGSAVGLGNVWKFPYMVGANGGAIFILFYLLSVVLIVIPIMIAELMLGRVGGENPVDAIQNAARETSSSGKWALAGWLGMAIAFLILSYFSAVAGWCIAYIYFALAGEFDGADPESTSALFDMLLASPMLLAGFQLLVVVTTVIIVARGLQKGVEQAVSWMMPLLFVLLITVVGAAFVIGDLPAAFSYLFTADLSEVRPDTALIALGQAFLSNSVAMGIMLIYGAYTTKNIALGSSAAIISGSDTLVALLAGLAVYPLIFAFGFAAGEGPGLIFVTLPVAFGAMPAGAVFGAIFFLLLTIAALTSTISLMEPVVSYLESRTTSSRWAVTISAGSLAFGIGLLTTLSFNVLSGFHPLGFLAAFASATVFDIVDHFVNYILLPVSALMLAIFVGWRLPRSKVQEELAMPNLAVFKLWYLLIRYLVPAALMTLFASNLWQLT